MSTGSSAGAAASVYSDKDNDSITGYPSTPDGADKQDTKRNRKRKGRNHTFVIYFKYNTKYTMQTT